MPLPAKFLSTESVVSVPGGYLNLLSILHLSFLSGLNYILKVTCNKSFGIEDSYFVTVAAGAAFFTLGAPGCTAGRADTLDISRASRLNQSFGSGLR